MGNLAKNLIKRIGLGVILGLLVLPVAAFAARTSIDWYNPSGTSYIQPNYPAGVDILIYGSNRYENFGTVTGSSGYGFRDNSGSMEFKNSGGAWTGIGSGGGGSAFPFTPITGGVATSTTVIFGNGLVSSASSTMAQTFFVGPLQASSTALFTNGFTAYSSSTLQNFSGVNSTTTNASTTLLAVTGSATTTFNRGIDLTGGCFSIAGTCVGGGAGGGSGTVNTGILGQLAYYAAAGTTLSGTSSQPLYVGALTATSTVSSVFATPPTFSSITGSSQCVHVDTNGLISGTGSECGNAAGTVSSGLQGQVGYYVNDGSTLSGSPIIGYASTTNQDTIFGYASGGNNATTSGTAKGVTAVGYQALNGLTTATLVTAVGYQALNILGSGGSNTAVGYQALSLNITGTGDTAVGSKALQKTTGANNTAVGAIALQSVTGGARNTGVGTNALTNETTSNDMTAIGYNSQGSDSAGDSSRSTFVGSSAAPNVNAGVDNTIIGALTMGNLVGNIQVKGNTTLGARIAQSPTSSADNNTFIGDLSAVSLTGGYDNIFLGDRSGQNVTTGAHNIMIGWNVLAQVATNNNQLNIGNIIFGTGLTATSSNTTVIPAATGNIGIGSTTPFASFSILGQVGTIPLAISSTTATSASTTLFMIDQAGDVHYGGGTPVLSSCGTTPSLGPNSTDQSGTIQVGSVSATTCTLTFSIAKASIPHCVVTSQTGTIAISYTETISALVVTNAALTGDKVDYFCSLGH